MTEAEIQRAVRLAVGQLPDVCIWRNTVGGGHIDGRYQRWGLADGSADLIGIGPGGKFLALEIKSLTGRLTLQQKLFLDLVTARGGIAAVVRSPEEALAVIARYRT